MNELLVPVCMSGVFTSLFGSAKCKVFAVFCTVCVFIGVAFDPECSMMNRVFCGFCLLTTLPVGAVGAWMMLDKETK